MVAVIGDMDRYLGSVPQVGEERMATERSIRIAEGEMDIGNE